MNRLDLSADKNIIYNYLKEIHLPVFPENFVLLVEYNSDIINNDDYPGQKLSEFINALSELDFPTFFVQILTSYSNIFRDLEYLNSVYNNGLPNVKLSNIDFIVHKEKHDTFCIMPWIHFYFNPQGQLHPCCFSDLNHPLGNYAKEQINFNSKKIIKFRETLINGKHAPQCSHCYKNEQLNLPSPRQIFNKKFEQYKPENLMSNINDFKLRYLDIRLSNLCNMQCRMCSGHYSSKIAAEDLKIWGNSKFLYNSNSSAHEEKLYKLVENNSQNIEYIYFAGGEPLINKFHYKILDLLLKNNNTDVNIRYNTNFSLIDQALPYWSKFSNISIGASIDLIGPAANYVRHGADYDLIVENFRKLQNYCPNVNFKITSILSIYNVFNLCDLQKEWLQILTPDNIQFNILTTPENMLITVLPKHFKKLAQEKIYQHIDFLQLYNAKHLIKTWKNALHLLDNRDDSHLLKSFFEIGDLRDLARGQKFEDYFSEFKELRKHII